MGGKLCFQDYDDKCTYTLNIDDTVTQVNGGQGNFFTALFPSTSNPESVKDGVFKYNDCFVKDGKEIDTDHLIKFSWCSTIRVYRDVFLTYDTKTKSWVLVRIIVS